MVFVVCPSVPLSGAQGEKLTSKEATDLFFGITKLFQSPNERLRRMVYLLIKNIQVSETEQFIVTSCLTKVGGCSVEAECGLLVHVSDWVVYGTRLMSNLANESLMTVQDRIGMLLS